MRKLFSILLLAVFGFPLVAPLYALRVTDEASLPACCRRAGEHHCTMGAAERKASPDSAPAFRTHMDRCPYAPRLVTPAHSDVGMSVSGSSLAVPAVTQPLNMRRSKSKRGVQHDQRLSDRGPPSVALS